MENDLIPTDKCEKIASKHTTQVNIKDFAPDKPNKELNLLEVQRNMPAPGPAPIAAVLLPGEHNDIRIDVSELLENGDRWLATPNIKFLGRRPLDLIGTPEETLLRDTLRSAIYSGMA